MFGSIRVGIFWRDNRRKKIVILINVVCKLDLFGYFKSFMIFWDAIKLLWIIIKCNYFSNFGHIRQLESLIYNPSKHNVTKFFFFYHDNHARIIIRFLFIDPNFFIYSVYVKEQQQNDRNDANWDKKFHNMPVDFHNCCDEFYSRMSTRLT